MYFIICPIHSHYTLPSNKLYEISASLSLHFFPSYRNCVLEENLLISKGPSVGVGTVITNSVIGRNCIIGEDKILLHLFVAVPCKALSFSHGHFAYVIYHIKKLLTL